MQVPPWLVCYSLSTVAFLLQCQLDRHLKYLHGKLTFPSFDKIFCDYFSGISGYPVIS